MFGWLKGKAKPASAEPKACGSCEAEKNHGLPWNTPDCDEADKRRRASLRPAEALRRGVLHRCVDCGSHWYLDEAGEWMTVVPDERVDLVRAWGSAPLPLPTAVREGLEGIGATPTAVDGYDDGTRRYPCQVVTADGELIDLAVLSLQSGPPLDQFTDFRLASEIAKVEPSPRAFSLAVRKAGSQAHELAMGYAPVLIEAPDKTVFTLNGLHEFYSGHRYSAADFRPSNRAATRETTPEVIEFVKGIVVFVADP